MSKSNRVGGLELAILEELWRRGEATVVQVHGGLLAERDLAPTTVSTMLRRMEEKGLVGHRTDDRRFVYRPLVERRELQRTMVGQLVDQLFGGSTAELVSHLVEEGEVDRSELERLRELIELKRVARGRSGHDA